jgi:putative Mg2+ transporter-C (MgtC) family protein
MLASIESWSAAIDAWFAGLGPPVEDVVRLVLAAVFGGLVGIEREVRGRQAGFRTYLLVCLGSALVMLVSVELAQRRWLSPGLQPGVNINVDPGRIAYGVMTGIGFLGAGVIVRNPTGTIRGLTTAAGLWCVAAMGLSIGFGMYLLSAMATILVVGTLWLLDYFEDALPRVRYRTVIVRVKYQIGCVAHTVDSFKKWGMDVVDAHLERDPNKIEFADIHLHVAFSNNDQYFNVERKLEADPTYQLMATREV